MLRRGWPTGLAVCLLLGVGLVVFGSTGHDDSHITYWSALALQRFGAIVNYNGERVEQGSSLAHVVLLALLGLVTRVPLPTLGPLTSIAGGAVTLALADRLGHLVAPTGPRAAALLAGTTACLVYWSFGGLETTLHAAAALWLVLTQAAYLAAPTRRRLVHVGLATLLFLLARPEAPLVLLCVVLALLGVAGARGRLGGAPIVRPALAIGAVAAAEALLVFGARRAYYGSFFPNPVYTKATGVDVKEGLAYLWPHVWPSGLWLLVGVSVGSALVLAAALRAPEPHHAPPEPRFAALLTAAFAGASLSFVVLTGGDWMVGGRFLAPIVPFLAVLAVLVIARFVPRPRAATAVVAALVAGNLAGTFDLANTSSSGRPIWSTGALRAQLDARIGPRGFGWFELVNKVHLRDTTAAAATLDLVDALRAARPDRELTLWSSQAGFVAYHLFAKHHGHVRFLDMCSLTTRDLLGCLPPSKFQRRKVGMQLHFERYFRERDEIDRRCGTRKPDLVLGLGGRGIEAVLEKNGYTIAWRQRGSIPNVGLGKKRWSVPLGSDEFVAVDTELLRGTSFTVKPAWAWDVR